MILALIAAAALAAPARAVNFDGSRARPEGEFVRAGPPTERRTAGQIAKDEQVKADDRLRAGLAARTTDPAVELAAPKPREWREAASLSSGAKGLAGLGVGLLVGGLIAYGLSRFTA
jgi:hypothetical protein